MTDVPLNLTADPEIYPVPVTVRLKPAPPTVADVGEIEVIVGTTLFTLKSRAPFDPPPGPGLLTLTAKLPAVAMSGAVTAIVTCVELLNVTVLALPLNVPVAPFTKLEPVMVKLNAAPPTVALLGESDVSVAGGLLTWKSKGVEGPPPGAGLVMTTGKDPAVAMSAAVTAIVTCVAETNVTVLALPLNVPVAPLTKFVPLIVKAKAAPPAVALAGENEVSVGTGLPTLALKFRWKYVVPPSPRTDEIMKKYCVPEVAAKDTCDCAIPAAALWLHATCVPVGVPLVTLSIVS